MAVRVLTLVCLLLSVTITQTFDIQRIMMGIVIRFLKQYKEPLDLNADVSKIKAQMKQPLITYIKKNVPYLKGFLDKIDGVYDNFEPSHSQLTEFRAAYVVVKDVPDVYDILRGENGIIANFTRVLTQVINKHDGPLTYEPDDYRYEFYAMSVRMGVEYAGFIAENAFNLISFKNETFAKLVDKSAKKQNRNVFTPDSAFCTNFEKSERVVNKPGKPLKKTLTAWSNPGDITSEEDKRMRDISKLASLVETAGIDKDDTIVPCVCFDL